MPQTKTSELVICRQSTRGHRLGGPPARLVLGDWPLGLCPTFEDRQFRKCLPNNRFGIVSSQPDATGGAIDGDHVTFTELHRATGIDDFAGHDVEIGRADDGRNTGLLHE